MAVSESSSYTPMLLAVLAFVIGYILVSLIMARRRSSTNKAECNSGEKHSAREETRENPRSYKANDEDKNRANHSEEEPKDDYQSEDCRYRRRQYFDKEIEQLHLKALELSERPSCAELKAVYRSMLAKYHPDKVSHLGKEFLLYAEKRTREINAAFEYFSAVLR
jgi:DnaJ-domain-containing protein 1